MERLLLMSLPWAANTPSFDTLLYWLAATNLGIHRQILRFDYWPIHALVMRSRRPPVSSWEISCPGEARHENYMSEKSPSW